MNNQQLTCSIPLQFLHFTLWLKQIMTRHKFQFFTIIVERLSETVAGYSCKYRIYLDTVYFVSMAKC